jgi:5'-nucleotidase
MRMPIPRWSFININFPPRPLKQLRGVRVVPLGRSTYTNPIAKQKHPNSLGRPKTGWLYWIVGEPKTLKKRGTDIEAVEQGYVSISPVRIELADHKLLARCRRAFS